MREEGLVRPLRRKTIVWVGGVALLLGAGGTAAAATTTVLTKATPPPARITTHISRDSVGNHDTYVERGTTDARRDASNRDGSKDRSHDGPYSISSGDD